MVQKHTKMRHRYKQRVKDTTSSLSSLFFFFLMRQVSPAPSHNNTLLVADQILLNCLTYSIKRNMIFWYSFVMFLIFELLFLFAFAKRRKIFIDLGTNDGTSVKQFVSGATGSNTAADGSKSLVGGWESFLSGVSEYNSTGWDIIALEANDQHLPSLTALKANLLDGNHTHVDSVSLYCPTAITTKNGQVEFIWDSPDGGYAGSTLMAGSRSAVGKRVLVPALDIITLFKREKISMKDFVVVKMDVEGAEYSIVRRILLSGIWRYIDRIAVEW